MKQKTAKLKMTQTPTEVLVNKIYLSLLVNHNKKIVILLYPGQKRKRQR